MTTQGGNKNNGRTRAKGHPVRAKKSSQTARSKPSGRAGGNKARTGSKEAPPRREAPPNSPSGSPPDHAAAGCFVLDAHGAILDANSAGVELLGRERGAVVGAAFSDFLTGRSRADFEAFRKALRGSTSPGACEVTLAERRGRSRHLHLSGIPAADAPGHRALLLATDITEFLLTEARLRASEERFRALASDAPIGIFLTDARGEYEYINPRWREMSGLAFEAALGDGWSAAIHPDDRQTVVDNWRRASASGGEWALEHRFQTPQGRITWAFAHTAPLLDDNGQICGYIGTCIDITDRKAVERALRESEARYRALFEEAPVAYHSLNASGLILDVNDPWLAMVGCRREEVIGRPFDDFLHPASKSAFWDHFARLKKERALPEALFTMRRKDHEQIIVSATTRAGYDPRGEFRQAHCVLHNVTEKERLQAELRRLATAIAHAGEYIIVTDMTGRIQYANPAFSAITGYAQEDAVGQTPRILKSGEHEPAFYRQMWQAISGGETWRGRMVNRRKDGSLFTADATISPVFDNARNLTHYVSVTRDVTRQVHLERRYRQAQKLEAVGHLAGGVAHDFNNLLHVITSCAKNAAAAVPENSAAARELRDTLVACDQAADLVSKLRAFSRRQVLRLAPLNMNEVLAESAETLHKIIGDNIRLEFRPSDGPLQVLADRGMIEQVLMNLAINARDAMPNGGRLLVETRLAAVRDAESRSHPCGRAGAFACLSVTDTGRHRNPDELGRIFQPYQAAEASGDPGGLCLSAVHGIAEQHNGAVDARSTPGGGTTFEVFFPIREPTARELPAKAPADVRGGTETILLAEDHDVIRRLAQRALENAGYTVLAARDGEEAVALFRHHAERVNLLLLDVVMPKLRGHQVCEAIRTIRPDIPALFQTGQHEIGNQTDFILGAGTALIHKPYDQTTLLQKVRETLDG